MNVIYYISTLRLPTEKAYGVNMVKTCEALGKQETDLRLITPRLRQLAEKNIYEYYGAAQSFSVAFLPSIDLVHYTLSFNLWLWRRGITSRPVFSWRWLYFAFLLDQLLLAISIWVYFSLGSRRPVIYTRSVLVGSGLKILGYQIYYDMHGFPYRFQWFWRLILRRFDGLTVTNHWKAERCRKLFKIKDDRILVAPNGFDAEAYGRPIDRQKIRQSLVSNPTRPIALYAGHLYDWKGAHVFALAAESLPEIDCVFIGGSDEDCKNFRQRFKGSNLMILGRKPYSDIAGYLRSADVLVQPNPGLSSESRLSHFATYDTSPIKLFEYLASGTTIVATDLPATSEILNQHNSVLVKPNDSSSLAQGIKRALADSQLAKQLARRALIDVQQYSWSARAGAILGFIYHDH